MSRRVVWEGRHERLTMEEKPGGDVCLMRTTDYDSGASRTLDIPAEAVPMLAAQLLGEGQFGTLLDQLGRDR